MMKKYMVWTTRCLGSLMAILMLTSTPGLGIMARMLDENAEPAFIEVLLSDNVVAPDGVITVTPAARDRDGQIIDNPQLRYAIRIDASGSVAGNPPVIEGQRIRFPKVVKRLINHNPTIDPNGEFADADPNDPNYGKETGGFYTVTATLTGSSLSGSADVVVLPSGTAAITVKTKQYGDQLGKPLGDMVNALAAGDQPAIEAAKRALRSVAANPDNSFDTLNANNVMAPPNGFPVTPAQLIEAGFVGSDDDARFSTTLDTIQTQLRQATARIHQINPASITQADVDALQAIDNSYQAISAQLAALQPSDLAVTQQGTKLNAIISSEIPKLLDAITQKSMAIADRLPASGAGFLSFVSTTFSILTDLSGFAAGNIIELSISLANDVLNVMAAEIINRGSAGGLSIEWVQASSSKSFVCPNYRGTYIGGNGFSRDPSKMKVVLLGCLDSQLLRNLLTLRPAGDLAAGIRLGFRIISIVQSLGRPQGSAAVVIPDRVEVVGDLWDFNMVFTNGWPRVNQGRLPCAGVVIVISLEGGGARATNRTFLPQCG